MQQDNATCYVGIDVGKDKLDIFIDQPSRPIALTVGNNAKGFATIRKKLDGKKIAVVVIEHSGRYERRCALDLMDAGYPVALINPRQARDFARSINQKAKNDLIDASLLAKFGRCVELRIAEKPEERRLELDELVGRRRQLVAIQAAEQTRLQQAIGKPVEKSIKVLLKHLHTQIADLERRIAEMIESHEDWRDLRKRFQEVPGVGKVASGTLVAELPEIGRINRQAIASLVGVAPFDRESGKWKGKRKCFGGRKQVRSTLYMAALSASHHNPIIRPLAERLKQAGKPHNVIMVACIRKLLLILNAIAASGGRWDPKMTSAA